MLLGYTISALVHESACYHRCCQRCHWLFRGRHPCPLPPFSTRYLQWRNSPLPVPETETAQHGGGISVAPWRSRLAQNGESTALRGQSQNGQDISMSMSKRSSLLDQVKRILPLSHLPRVPEHRPILTQLYHPHQDKMGSASTPTPFTPLGETSLFKPLDLGKWHLQHRIVQVGAAEHGTGSFSPDLIGLQIYSGASHTDEE